MYGIECELNVLELHTSSGCWPHSESCISIMCSSLLWNMTHTYPFLLKRDAYQKALRISELKHGGHCVRRSYTTFQVEDSLARTWPRRRVRRGGEFSRARRLSRARLSSCRRNESFDQNARGSIKRNFRWTRVPPDHLGTFASESQGRRRDETLGKLLGKPLRPEICSKTVATRLQTKSFTEDEATSPSAHKNTEVSRGQIKIWV